MDVEAMVRPVVESSGLELVEVGFHKEGGRRVLRVTVDREGGIDLETIAATSERISRRLDLEDAVRSAYSLEVSSPGIERALRSAKDFARAVGAKVKVKTAEPVRGSRTHTGELVAVDDDGIVIAADGAEEIRVVLDQIASARTVFEWGKKAAK